MGRAAPARVSIRVAQPDADLTGETLVLTAPAVHYLTVVRRLGADDAITVFDARGQSRAAQLATQADGWQARFTGPLVQAPDRPDVTLCYGLPKGEKLDRVVRQVTELGITRVRLLSCARSVVRLSGERAQKRVARLTRIAQEAARQSGRADVPTIEGPFKPDQAVATAGPHRLVLHPEGGVGLSDVMLSAAQPIEVYVGPEGGFSPEELAAFARAGAVQVRLNSPVLRTETAAPIACGLVLHRLGAL